MRRVIGLVLVAAFLGGCAVYADPYSFRASGGIYAPAPAPVHRDRGYDRGWHRGYRDGYRD
jgi:hypothetical protein